MRLLQNVYRPIQHRSKLVSIPDHSALVSSPGAHMTALESDIRLENGAVQRRLNSLLRKAHYDSTQFMEIANQRLLEGQQSLTQQDVTTVGLLFLLSVLNDLHCWGARIEIRNSQLVVRNLHSTFDANDHDRVRNALMRLRRESVTYIPPLNRQRATEVLLNGSFELVSVDKHSDTAADDFRRGITTWSMPYRGREGRSTRFVLYGSDTPGVRYPVGLLEVGDDAPHSPLRDTALGLGPQAFSDAERKQLAVRMSAFRHALKPEGLPYKPFDKLSVLLRELDAMKEAGKGRIGTRESIEQRKRITYLARFVAAEAALRALKGSDDRWISEGIRAVRDLTIPRIHMEMTVCGALPPFGEFLAGKLVAAMGIHPSVRRLVDRPIGTIAASSFDVSKLAPLLPNAGLLFLTTKGLYPGHSAQYTSVKFPGDCGSFLPLRKLGHTTGQTTSHMSDLTMRLATEFSNRTDPSAISRSYGSGGAKRQRSLEKTIRLLGLSGTVVHAQLSRPVYGVELVSNIRDVTLFGAEPAWTTSPFTGMPDGDQYVKEAADIWRTKHSQRVRTRAADL